MRTRLTWIRVTWILTLLALVAIGVLMACSTKYSSSSNGLLIVPSQGGGVVSQNSPVMETFSLDLANGHPSEINNVNGPPTSGLPQAIILDPAGAFAYVIVYQNAVVPGGGVTGIESCPVASDGKLGTGSTATLNQTSPTVSVVCETPGGPQPVMVAVQPTPVIPIALVIDSAGKYLFVADAATSGQTQPYSCNGAMVTSTVAVPGTVSVFAVSSGALSEVAGSPFALPTDPGATTASASALAITRTSYPPVNAYCSGFTPPTTENLYVTDSVNYVLLNFSVSSTGALVPVPTSSTVGVATGPGPDGVAVDPCNRFVYVSNASSGNNANTISAFTICSTNSQPNCQSADFSLFPVNHSPFTVSPGDGPGPLSVDAYGYYLYVVNVGSSTVSSFKISPATGSLVPLSPAFVSTGGGANSIAIRSDDSWMFVANGNGNFQTVSEFGIIPGTGELMPQTPISTFNLPSGVAVK